MNGNEILRLMENRPGPLLVAKILCRYQPLIAELFHHGDVLAIDGITWRKGGRD